MCHVRAKLGLSEGNTLFNHAIHISIFLPYVFNISEQSHVLYLFVHWVHSADMLGFLYYTSNSGYLASGSLTRLGDRHVMQSILSNDCSSDLFVQIAAFASSVFLMFSAFWCILCSSVCDAFFYGFWWVLPLEMAGQSRFTSPGGCGCKLHRPRDVYAAKLATPVRRRSIGSTALVRPGGLWLRRIFRTVA